MMATKPQPKPQQPQQQGQQQDTAQQDPSPEQQESVLAAASRALLTQTSIEAVPGVSVDEPLAIAAVELPEAGTKEYREAVEQIRAKRKAWGTSAQKLALPERRGYHRHWFNDDPPGRVQEAINNGWGHVLDQNRKPVSRIVGSGRHGGALRAYAMELPQVLWEEDQAVLQKHAKDRVDDIRGAGAFRAPPGQAKKSDQNKFYSPREEPVTQHETLVRSPVS